MRTPDPLICFIFCTCGGLFGGWAARFYCNCIGVYPEHTETIENSLRMIGLGVGLAAVSYLLLKDN